MLLPFLKRIILGEPVMKLIVFGFASRQHRHVTYDVLHSFLGWWPPLVRLGPDRLSRSALVLEAGINWIGPSANQDCPSELPTR